MSFSGTILHVYWCALKQREMEARIGALSKIGVLERYECMFMYFDRLYFC